MGVQGSPKSQFPISRESLGIFGNSKLPGNGNSENSLKFLSEGTKIWGLNEFWDLGFEWILGFGVWMDFGIWDLGVFKDLGLPGMGTRLDSPPVEPGIPGSTGEGIRSQTLSGKSTDSGTGGI